MTLFLFCSLLVVGSDVLQAFGDFLIPEPLSQTVVSRLFVWWETQTTLPALTWHPFQSSRNISCSWNMCVIAGVVVVPNIVKHLGETLADNPELYSLWLCNTATGHHPSTWCSHRVGLFWSRRGAISYCAYLPKSEDDSFQIRGLQWYEFTQQV